MSPLESITEHKELINESQTWDEVRSLHVEAGMFVTDGIQEGGCFLGVFLQQGFNKICF